MSIRLADDARGYRWPRVAAVVDPEAVQAFNAVIRSTAVAARMEVPEAIPPTMLFCLHMTALGPSYYGFYLDRDIELGRLLHGEQHFSYHRPIYPGDELSFDTRVAAIDPIKGGAMTKLMQHVAVFGADKVLCAELNTVVLIRNAMA